MLLTSSLYMIELSTFIMYGVCVCVCVCVCVMSLYYTLKSIVTNSTTL